MKLIKSIKKLTVLATSYFASYAAFAATTVKGDGEYQKIGEWFNSYIAFMQGPLAKAAIVVSVILAVLVWNFAPKDGIMGGMLRTVISGLVVLNAATWVTSFGGDGSS